MESDEPNASVSVSVSVSSNRRRRWRWVVLGTILAGLPVELVLAWPYVSRAVESLSDANPTWLLFAVGAEMCSMGAFARVQRRMLAAGGPRVPIGRMIRLTYAANAVSVSLPGGSVFATGYVFQRFRTWGATGPAAGFTLLASGALSTVAFGLLVVLVAILAGSSALVSALGVPFVAVVAVVGYLSRHARNLDAVLALADRLVARFNRMTRRPTDSGLAMLQSIRAGLTEIRPRRRDWLFGLGFAELNWLADLACLIACCRAVGTSNLTVALVMIAYVAGISAANLSLLPGGLGVVDAAMIFALTHGGIGPVRATAAVLLYRLVSFALIVAMGWVLVLASWAAGRRATVPAAGAVGGRGRGSKCAEPDAELAARPIGTGHARSPIRTLAASLLAAMASTNPGVVAAVTAATPVPVPCLAHSGL